MKKKTKFCIFYEKWIEKIIPKYAFFSVIFCFVFNSLIYTGLQFLMSDAKHYDLTMAADRVIPFVSEWSIIYLGCFLFWAINYILITRQGKKGWFQFATGDYLSRIVCGIFFVLIPTTNVRPKVIGNGIGEILIRFVYAADAPTNLFPSVHCLVSWMCFIAIYKKNYIPKWYQIFSCIFALAVCASTLFTKQHFVVDVISGILIAQLCYYIGHHTKMALRVQKVFEKLNDKVFGESMDEE